MSISKLTDIWRSLQSSYWFLPTFMVISAILLAVLMSWLDSCIDASWLSRIQFLFNNEPEGARVLLSSIAGSMITVAGVTFSMTMVAVSTAASQFGPRLVGNFMRDTGNQVTLGVFIATFAYCLVVLSTVRSASEAGAENELLSFIPHLSVLVGLFMALACVAVLIYYIHHIPETINIANITSNLGHQLCTDIDTIFPENFGLPPEEVEQPLDTSQLTKLFSGCRQIKAKQQGYIVLMDSYNLTQFAIENDCLIRIEFSPGDFVVNGDVLFHCTPIKNLEAQKQEKKLLSFLAIHSDRTPDQNLLYLVDQLVEIMVRALSPGVNDPSTAINCLHWLTGGLIKMTNRDIPGSQRYDDDGKLRLVVKSISFKHFCDKIFSQSLQHVATERSVSLEMLSMIAEAALVATNDIRKKLLLEYAAEVEVACLELLPLKRDRDLISARYKEILAVVEDSSLEKRLRDNQSWLGGSA